MSPARSEVRSSRGRLKNTIQHNRCSGRLQRFFKPVQLALTTLLQYHRAEPARPRHAMQCSRERRVLLSDNSRHVVPKAAKLLCDSLPGTTSADDHVKEYLKAGASSLMFTSSVQRDSRRSSSSCDNGFVDHVAC